MEQPAWLTAAWAQFGVREAPGAANAAQVLAYFQETGRGDISSDATPWCAAFVGAMLVRSGLKSTGSLLARSYLDWGEALNAPRPGAITVLTRGDDPGAGHVAFYLGESGSKIFLLGGNQSDAVTVEAYDTSRLLGFRWPASEPAPDADTGSAPAAATPAPLPDMGTEGETPFPAALRHVLEMEGGFSDDPYDPGGPTNRGITLDVYARWTGETVTASSRARLIAALKHISDETVEAIYRVRYWEPASCATFAAPLALMHFDAAVNHGVGGAARLLQQAVSADVDGAIGPQTISAIEAHGLAEVLSAYADVRRRRYRALPHFWRFGRGWLRRVDATLELARAWAERSGADQPVSEPKQTAKATGDKTMSDFPRMPGVENPEPETKWWLESKTVWGTLITAAATVLPILGPIFGFNVTGEVVRQLGDQAAAIIQAAAGLFGTLLALYGRSQARAPLTLRSDDRAGTRWD